MATLLAEALGADRPELQRRLDALRRLIQTDQPHDRAQARLAQLLRQSIERRRRRIEAIPEVTFPPDLPVVQKRGEIARAIQDHQVVVVCGETGSGKSTQLPKICLELGRGVDGLIGHTQPRRIAARSVAARVAEELGAGVGGVGGVVGYKVRFGDETSDRTCIKLMTDGILLAETQGDPLLTRYDTLIIDEAHERSLNIDFLLGYIRRILPRRPGLKVIITSATIDPQRFADHFTLPGGPPAPMINVSGRTYPVEVRYRPAGGVDIDEQEDTIEHAIVSGVAELAAHGPGDILVFLPGEREIRETAALLDEAGWTHRNDTELVQLFARLSAADQMRVFAPHSKRRIVLSTNVAETSVTVPGIHYVIDSGLARVSRYSPRTKVQRLPIEPISQASADQRKGRCGRIAPGVCLRLYDEQEFLARPRFTEPEILRTSLASVILQMMSLRLGDPAHFPFVDPPEHRLIQDGYETLFELGAVEDAAAPALPAAPPPSAVAGAATSAGRSPPPSPTPQATSTPIAPAAPAAGSRRLTRLGLEMARFPVDPRISRMILAGRTENALAEVVVIAAALSVQDPRERPMDRQEAADRAHERFRDERSDFLSHLKLWAHLREKSDALSHSRLRRYCRDNFLSFVRFREWEETHRQLLEMAQELGCRPNPRPATYDQVHRALLAGLLSSVGVKKEAFEYAGPRGLKFNLFPGSGLFKKGPRWVMSAELVRTTKLYARTNAEVQPQWLEDIGRHLLKRSHFDPHWDEKAQRVNAYERVTLLGLEIVSRRRVHYGPIDPPAARALFIHHGLVEGELRTAGEFARHNAALASSIADREAKLRRPGLLGDPQMRASFFEQRLPPDVYSADTFERWRERAELDRPDLLFMQEADILAAPADAPPDRYPDHLQLDGAALPLTYKLDLGAPDDGLTLTAPVEALMQLEDARGEWLVPGLLKEKVELLIRSLPKSIRTNFVPVEPFAAAVVDRLTTAPPPDDDLLEAVAQTLGNLSGLEVPRSAFRPSEIPDHLRLNYRFVDAAGQSLGAGRDLRLLRRELTGRLAGALERLAPSRFNRAGLSTWDFGDLPDAVDVRPPGSGMAIRAVPGLVDEAAAPPSPQPRRQAPGGPAALAPSPGPAGPVALRLFALAARAAEAHHAGTLKLFLLDSRDDLDRAVRHLEDFSRLAVHYATLGTTADLRSSLGRRAAELVFLDGRPAVRTQADYQSRLAEGRPRLGRAVREVSEVLARILAGAQRVNLALDAMTAPALEPAVKDVRSQLASLMPRGFVASTPWEWLREYPRYLAAIEARLRKLTGGGLLRDHQRREEFTPRWQAFLHSQDEAVRTATRDPELETYRWMLEEWRVSLFAQEIGTKIKISAQRLDRQWARVGLVSAG